MTVRATVALRQLGRVARGALFLGAIFSLAGCHSAFVQVTINNHSGGPLHVFELDYPSASFGSSELASGASYHYRFKVVGSGASKFTWTAADQKDHIATGPELHEGEEGRLMLDVDETTVQWKAQLHDVK